MRVLNPLSGLVSSPLSPPVVVLKKGGIQLGLRTGPREGGQAIVYITARFLGSVHVS